MKKLAETILKESYGKEAIFRDGQYEAIQSALNKNRTIVVQRTGWGKSLVYFTSTKLNRMYGRGVTIIICPLLVLMENQIAAAKKFNLKCAVLNSTVKDKYARAKIIDNLKKNIYDVFFVSPETLLNDELQGIISRIKIGMFVIDECHCISDWGHDFRPEYSRQYEIIETLPKNIPILGTTATANDRVIEDLKEQFGEETFISRGPLTRASMSIEIVKLGSKALKYAWILKNLPIIPGSGIIYCMSRRECDMLSQFLNKNGIEARPYYSDPKKDVENVITEKFFMENKVKVIVATIKLGMGYDKPDIEFVIHFQKPKNVVEYYQQIGRAGRGIPNSYCYLLTGEEDDKIHHYFINNAFPTETEAKQIVGLIKKTGRISQAALSKVINIRRSKLERFLPILVKEKVIDREGMVFKITQNTFEYNREYYEKIKKIRGEELQELNEYIKTSDCLSKYIVNSLDDTTSENCGKCSNCIGGSILLDTNNEITHNELIEIQEYLNSIYLEIEPRKLWTDKKRIPNPNHKGYALAIYGDSGLGEMVQNDIEAGLKFRELLIDKSVEVLRKKVHFIDDCIITYVPSLRNDRVETFTKELAEKLGIPFMDLLGKNEAPTQIEMENSHHKETNAVNSFYFKGDKLDPSKMILIDDFVDSRWTLSACGLLLKQNGAQMVIPYCLADSSYGE